MRQTLSVVSVTLLLLVSNALSEEVRHPSLLLKREQYLELQDRAKKSSLESDETSGFRAFPRYCDRL